MRIDLGTLARVTSVEQHFKDVDTWDFVIEGSVNGSTWSMLFDGTDARGSTFRHPVTGSFRYIRLTLTSSASGYWAGSVELKVIGFDNLAQGKTATASSAAAGFETSRALDGNTSTFWGAANPSFPQWLRVDLGAPAILNRIEQSFMDDDVWGFTIEGSLDGSAWSMLVDHAGGASGQHFASPVAGTYRYVRLTVLSNDAGHWACSQELKVYGTPVSRNLAVGVRARSSTHGLGFEPRKAVDGNPTSYWGADSPAMPQWLEIDLGNEAILERVEQSFVDHERQWFKVEGSRDQTQWTMLLDGTKGLTGRVYSQPVSGRYRYLRFTMLDSENDHWASSQELRAIGVGSPVTSRWWEQTSGVMRYFPKFYGNTLASIMGDLEGLKAQGYTAIELAGIHPGPATEWAGLGATDLYEIDPALGTLADFDALIRRAHELGMSVHYFANPGYTHVTASTFRQAERDFCDGRDTTLRRWFDFRSTAPSPTEPEPDHWQPSTQCPGRAWWFERWGDPLPAYNWLAPEWRAEARKYLRFWADRGVDGVGLDAPERYHRSVPQTRNEVIASVLGNYDLMLNPEGVQTYPEYPVYVTNEHYNVIHDLTVTHWGGSGYSRLVSAMDAQNPNGLDAALKNSRDAVNAVRGTTLTPVSWELDGIEEGDSRPDVPPNKRLLEVATLTTMGTLFYLHNGNHHILPHVERIPNWPAADQAKLTALVKAQSSYDGLSPAGVRVKLPTIPSGDAQKFYAYKRTNKEGTVTALVILNYQNSPQRVTIDFTGTGIGAQVPVDLVTGGAGTPITGTSYGVDLPAYGFAVLAVR